jgi:cyclase
MKITKRVIPTFLLKGKRLVKGGSFSNHVDVGDPISQAQIYDAQGADEIVLLDILARGEARGPNLDVINQIAKNCRLPLAVGGGISTVEQALACIGAGADKVILNTSALKDPKIIPALANVIGSSSVLISLDVKRENPTAPFEVYSHAATEKCTIKLKDFISDLEHQGAGELMVTDIDHEGNYLGYNLDLYREITQWSRLPLIASGGAGNYKHIIDLFKITSVDACAIGKMLFLRDYDIVRIKAFMTGQGIDVRDA